jgi:predicted PolB exonuclease-like 3'-5' exonuclease
MGAIRYLVFGMETVPNADLIQRYRYPSLDTQAALQAYLDYRSKKYGGESVPPFFQRPVSVVVGLVDEEHKLQELRTLDEPDFDAERMAWQFWGLKNDNPEASFVTYKGGTHELGVMEFYAYRLGIPAASWFGDEKREHLDLMDWYSNWGRLAWGGLPFMSAVIGVTPKPRINVKEALALGKIDRVAEQCRNDVVDCYKVFLQSRIMRGQV